MSTLRILCYYYIPQNGGEYAGRVAQGCQVTTTPVGPTAAWENNGYCSTRRFMSETKGGGELRDSQMVGAGCQTEKAPRLRINHVTVTSSCHQLARGLSATRHKRVCARYGVDESREHLEILESTHKFFGNGC